MSSICNEENKFIEWKLKLFQKTGIVFSINYNSILYIFKKDKNLEIKNRILLLIFILIKIQINFLKRKPIRYLLYFVIIIIILLNSRSSSKNLLTYFHAITIIFVKSQQSKQIKFQIPHSFLVDLINHTRIRKTE